MPSSQVHLRSTPPRKTDALTIGEVAERSGIAVSAVRHYDSLGLIAHTRSGGGHRIYPRPVLRRIAAIRAGQRVGLSLTEIGESLAFLPVHAAPSKQQWRRISASWRPLLEARIAELEAVRDNLADCVGCGCLSMRQCALYNPQDALAATGSGARRKIPGA